MDWTIRPLDHWTIFWTISWTKFWTIFLYFFKGWIGSFVRGVVYHTLFLREG